MESTSDDGAVRACWALAGSVVLADALAFALDTNLFDALADQPKIDAAALASRLALHTGNTRHLLDTLWSMGLLIRSDDASPTYALPDATRRYFCRRSPQFCGDAWAYRLRSLRHAGTTLAERVRTGHADTATALQTTAENWAQAARVQIGQEQRAMSVPVAMDVLAKVPGIGHCRNLLDLGGGPGWIAIELARRNPALHGVVFDWPATARVAAENIAAMQLGERLRALGGDICSDPVGQDYDLVWCASVLHFVSDPLAVLRKVRAAMAPGGHLVCAQAEVGQQADDARRVLPFYLPMMLAGRHVTRAGGLAVLLRQAGFEVTQDMNGEGFPMTPLRVVVGRKPG